MAETMKRLVAVTLLIVAGAAGAGAQPVQDPTRPPAQFIHPTTGGVLASSPQVQSILVGRGTGGRRVAVIDGNLVRVGDRVGDARVVAIGATTVQLQRPGGRATLTLPAPGATPGLRPE